MPYGEWVIRDCAYRANDQLNGGGAGLSGPELAAGLGQRSRFSRFCTFTKYDDSAMTNFDVTIKGMSPTIFREDGFRFYFFSREEPRMHVHVQCADGEAKFWLEPAIELAKNYRLSDRQISSIRTLIEAHAHEFRSAWTKHFGG